MSLSNIQQIRDIEEASESIINLANLEAQKLLADARKNVEELIKKSKSDAESEANQLGNIAKEETEKEKSIIDKKFSEKKNKLHESKKSKMNDATDMIVKLISE